MLHSQRKPVLIAPKRLEPSPALEADLDVEMADDEPIVIVEPTDPDEDRLKAAEDEEGSAAPMTVEESETNKPSEDNNGGPCVPQEAADKPAKTQVTGITTDPVLLNQILHALSAKPVKSSPVFSVPVVTSESSLQALTPVNTTAAANHVPQARLLVASSNVYTIQAQTPIQARAGAPTSPLTVSQISPITTIDSSATGAAVRDETGVSQPITNGPPQPTNLQNLITTNPLLSAVLVNCATANLLTQLANSISSSMLSLAQSIAVEKQQNMAGQISELTQMLSALTSLASTLSSSLPSLANLRTNSATPTNPILTSLISQINTSSSTPMVSSVIPLASLKLVTGTEKAKTDSVPSTISTIPLPSVSAYGTTMSNLTISPLQSTPIPIVTAARTAATSRVLDQIGLSGVITAVPSSVSPSVIAVAAAPPITSATQATMTSAPSCSVKYFCASDLDRHKLVHLVPTSGDPLKRHLCPYPGCGKAYSKLNKLREHVRSHTGERPYVCEHPGCNASFIRLYGLKRHQLTHFALSLKSDERRYPTILPVSAARPTETAVIVAPAGAILPQNAIVSITTVPAPFTGAVAPAPSSPPVSAIVSPSQLVTKPEPTSPPPAPTTPVVPSTEVASVSESDPATFVPKPEETSAAPLPSPQDTQPPPSMVTTAALPTTVPTTVTVVARSTTAPTPAPNGTITIKNCPASRFSKASATPSASAMALKAVVIPGPFGKRRHICPMLGCKKIFPKLNKLREHICRHTGERPYACEECPATFVRMYDLRRHALIHLRKKNGLLSNVQ
ncbi:hypothetical protein AAHC03_020888 [Spirometra sp. Aus1]